MLTPNRITELRNAGAAGFRNGVTEADMEGSGVNTVAEVHEWTAGWLDEEAVQENAALEVVNGWSGWAQTEALGRHMIEAPPTPGQDRSFRPMVPADNIRLGCATLAEIAEELNRRAAVPKPPEDLTHPIAREGAAAYAEDKNKECPYILTAESDKADFLRRERWGWGWTAAQDKDTAPGAFWSKCDKTKTTA